MSMPLNYILCKGCGLRVNYFPHYVRYEYRRPCGEYILVPMHTVFCQDCERIHLVETYTRHTDLLEDIERFRRRYQDLWNWQGGGDAETQKAETAILQRLASHIEHLEKVEDVLHGQSRQRVCPGCNSSAIEAFEFEYTDGLPIGICHRTCGGDFVEVDTDGGIRVSVRSRALIISPDGRRKEK